MDDLELDRRFNYHKPDAAAQAAHQQVRNGAKYLGELLDTILPEGREKALAFTNLEQAMFWANAAIARPDLVDIIYPPEIPATNDPAEALALNGIEDTTDPVFVDEFSAPAPDTEEAEDRP